MHLNINQTRPDGRFPVSKIDIGDISDDQDKLDLAEAVDVIVKIGANVTSVSIYDPEAKMVIWEKFKDGTETGNFFTEGEDE